MRKTSSFVLLVLLLLISACNKSEIYEMPDLGMNVGDLELNTYIQVTAPKEGNTFKSGKSISLEVINLSEKVWEFDTKEDILIFQNENKIWKMVSNNMIYIGKTDMTLSPPGESPLNKQIVNILPEVEDGKSIFLRIFIIAHEQSFEEEVQNKGAFMDLTLKP